MRGVQEYRNVDPIFGFLIHKGAIKYKELWEDYTYEDVMYIYESIIIPEYNKMVAEEYYAKKARK